MRWSDELFGVVVPSQRAMMVMAGVTTWWKWSDVGYMVLMAVRMTRSPGSKALSSNICCRCERKETAISSGNVLEREWMWRIKLSTTTNGGFDVTI